MMTLFTNTCTQAVLDKMLLKFEAPSLERCQARLFDLSRSHIHTTTGRSVIDSKVSCVKLCHTH